MLASQIPKRRGHHRYLWVRKADVKTFAVPPNFNSTTPDGLGTSFVDVPSAFDANQIINGIA
jgi:hypothetical protein